MNAFDENQEASEEGSDVHTGKPGLPSSEAFHLMNYLNLHTDLLRSEDYLGAEPVERATWLNLMAWCATQENGGTIKNAVEWGDRKWQQIVGVTLNEVQTPSELYHFIDGGHLVVNHYPKDKEEEVKRNRVIGSDGGKAKTQAKTQAARVNGKRGGRPKNPSENPSENPTERKGREGKGKEREGKGTIIAPTQAIAWSEAGGWQGISEKDYQDWEQAYPACNIDRQLATANQWLLSNPSKAKKKQWRRFITGWLGRAQERGGDTKTNPTQSGTGPYKILTMKDL